MQCACLVPALTPWKGKLRCRRHWPHASAAGAHGELGCSIRPLLHPQVSEAITGSCQAAHPRRPARRAVEPAAGADGACRVDFDVGDEKERAAAPLFALPPAPAQPGQAAVAAAEVGNAGTTCAAGTEGPADNKGTVGTALIPKQNPSQPARGQAASGSALNGRQPSARGSPVPAV